MGYTRTQLTELLIRVSYIYGRGYFERVAIDGPQVVPFVDREYDDVPWKFGMTDIGGDIPSAHDSETKNFSVEGVAPLFVVALCCAMGKGLRYIAATGELVFRERGAPMAGGDLSPMRSCSHVVILKFDGISAGFTNVNGISEMARAGCRH